MDLGAFTPSRARLQVTKKKKESKNGRIRYDSVANSYPFDCDAILFDCQREGAGPRPGTKTPGGGAVDPLDDLRPAVGASFFFTRRRGAARSHCHRSSSAVQSSSSPVEATRWTEMFFVLFSLHFLVAFPPKCPPPMSVGSLVSCFVSNQSILLSLAMISTNISCCFRPFSLVSSMFRSSIAVLLPYNHLQVNILK